MILSQTDTYKVQRDRTQKMHIHELWFLRSAFRPMLVNISMKFHEYILIDFKFIVQT